MTTDEEKSAHCSDVPAIGKEKAFANIAIVLVRPSHPGNIGAVARAMKNMGLTTLRLVEPAAAIDAEAHARAAGADDVLVAATRHADLTHAIADCALAIGTSARTRKIAWPVLSVAAAAQQAIAGALAGKVALVFGAERTGLTNDELDRCQAVINIPTAPDFASLNLAAAVQIVTYEVRQAALAATPARETGEALASQAEVERFYVHLESVLIEIGFLNPQHPRKLMRRLKRLFNRAGLDQNEVNILRGILTEIERTRGQRNT